MIIDERHNCDAEEARFMYVHWAQGDVVRRRGCRTGRTECITGLLSTRHNVIQDPLILQSAEKLQPLLSTRSSRVVESC